LNSYCEINFGGDEAWTQAAPAELALALAAAGRKQQAEPGQRLFSFGEPAAGVFLILQGKVRAALPGEPGHELMRLTAGPGALLGLPSALCAKSYQFDVQALETVETAYLPVEQLNELLRQHPELGMQAMSMMCNEMSALQQTKEHLSRCENQGCALHGFCMQAAKPE
jgi:CRP/FNR family transcriptional regulator